jgi:hypothetical protein
VASCPTAVHIVESFDKNPMHIKGGRGSKRAGHFELGSLSSPGSLICSRFPLSAAGHRQSGLSCNSRLFWVAPQLVFGLLQEFARVMQVVIMHQRRRAVRPGAMKTTTPSTDCPCSANEDVTDKLRAGRKSITSSGYEVAEPQCKSGPSCANHCRSRECRCASLNWRLLVTTRSIHTTVRTLPCPDAICEFVLQHWH